MSIYSNFQSCLRIAVVKYNIPLRGLFYHQANGDVPLDG